MINVPHALHCFRFRLFGYKLDSAGHYPCGKQLHDTIHFSWNVKKVSDTFWHKRPLQRFQNVCVSIWADSYQMKTNVPFYVKLFKGVTINREIMISFIYLHGFSLYLEAYIKYLKELALTWIERMATERQYIWQNDYVQWYTNQKTSKKTMCCHHLWYLATKLPRLHCSSFSCVRHCWTRDQQNSLQY